MTVYRDSWQLSPALTAFLHLYNIIFQLPYQCLVIQALCSYFVVIMSTFTRNSASENDLCQTRHSRPEVDPVPSKCVCVYCNVYCSTSSFRT